jgi:hypothetical protein
MGAASGGIGFTYCSRVRQLLSSRRSRLSSLRVLYPDQQRGVALAQETACGGDLRELELALQQGVHHATLVSVVYDRDHEFHQMGVHSARGGGFLPCLLTEIEQG